MFHYDPMWEECCCRWKNLRVQTLVSWWSDYPEELLTQRVLQPLQKYLTTELVVTKKLTVSVMNTIKVSHLP